MNHTTLALVAILAAAALVIGTLASPAFADSSKTITKQVNKQKQKISGDGSEGIQNADNCIAVLNGANACRQQGEE
jgi:ABC-type phosphate transport system substrate-binding protein